MKSLNFTIAVAQMDCVAGETEPNLNKIAHFAALAKRLGAGLVIFPECATTGYFIGDKLATLADGPDGPAARRLGDVARQNAIDLLYKLASDGDRAARQAIQTLERTNKIVEVQTKG